MTECPFCRIVAGGLPASIVWQDDIAVAFMDLRQAVPGHVLVVPREHVEDIHALDENTGAHLMRLVIRIANALKRALPMDGLNLWQSNGAAGGQEVPHVHLHVQPRRDGDGLLQVYPELPIDVDRITLETLAAAVRTQLDQQEAGDPQSR